MFMGPMTFLMRQLVDGERNFTLAQNLLQMLRNQNDLLLQWARSVSQKLGKS